MRAFEQDQPPSRNVYGSLDIKKTQFYIEPVLNKWPKLMSVLLTATEMTRLTYGESKYIGKAFNVRNAMTQEQAI